MELPVIQETNMLQPDRGIISLYKQGLIKIIPPSTGGNKRRFQ